MKKQGFKNAFAAAAVVALAAVGVGAQAQTSPYPNVGRSATPKEVQAWDIDVRPDFKGLPKGAGSVAKGMDVWEGKCAHCHGVFGESNEVFSPLVGGTTKDDIVTGRVARLNDTTFPGRTTLMKVSTVSTLWDYINRAMPWTAPKSLSVEEVYAVTAYLLNMAGVVPDDFVMSDKNIDQVQARMPNRNGMTLAHGLWPGKGMGTGKPDAQGSSCMTNCATEPKVSSFLPDFARNAHGNLAEQNRPVGAQHGSDTTKPPLSAPVGQGQAVPAKPVAAAAPGAAAVPAAGPSAAVVNKLLNQNSCTACHAVSNKLVGPAFRDVAKKYAGRADAVAYLSGRIRSGGSGVWGAIPMPAQTISEPDAKTLAEWLANGAKN